jgi:signal transduction histidine kinase
MKKLQAKLSAKICAVFLFCVMLLICAAGAVGIFVCIRYDVYLDSGRSFRESVLSDLSYSQMNDILADYESVIDYPSEAEYFEQLYASDNCNLSFTISNARGDVLYQNYEASDTQFSHTWEIGSLSNDYAIQGSVRTHFTANDRYSSGIYWADMLIAWRYGLIVIAAVSLVLLSVLLIFLLCAAGHKEGTEEICANWVDRIPFDLYFALLLAAGCLSCVALGEGVAGLILPALFCPPLIASLLMSFATRCKLGSWWRNTVIYRVLRFFWRLLRRLWRDVCTAFASLSLTWKTALLCAVFAILTMLLTADGQWFWWLVLMIAVTVFLLLASRGAHLLQKAGAELAAGNMDCKVDTSHMPGAFKAHGENLNRIQDGIQLAVEEKLKSERLKTELITNVSHDIKTPLTSIINYVDLLKKEPVSTDAAKEYLDVLDRQSARLKKLIEDLVEASKASTGNINVHFEDTDLNMLLSQAGAEYEAKFARSRLEPVWNLTADSPRIRCDGQLLWRVFDNLMNNICKYALEGTRVYFSTEVKGGRAVVTMKNVSRSALNISSDELMERFVRGDSSRNTEGSGLGLSIAKSLTDLQHGSFSLDIDGDLFKATVSFETVAPPMDA